MLKLILISAALTIASARPGNVGKTIAISASAEDTGGIPPLFSFDNGGVGVNFLGFRASAGLGGLLTGNAADGGLHAEAGTPFGQSAGAGLGGALDANGRSAGGLYAGATAGGGVGAGAALAGSSGASGAVGGSYAGASSGGVETHITKIAHKAPAAAVSGKLIANVAAAPAPVSYQKDVELIAEQPKPKAHTTYVERTVIPNYVEKRVQVPSYVEKTIRVPTYVEKTVRVPAPPTVIEKEVEAPKGVFETRGSFEAAAPQTFKVVEKTKVRTRPLGHSHIHIRKNFGLLGGGGGGGYYAAGGGYGQAGGSQFFDNIFNIPISTLRAVNQLVSGVAGGASGSFAVSKSVGAAV